MGEEAWRMYWVHWNTRKARLARKSRGQQAGHGPQLEACPALLGGGGGAVRARRRVGCGAEGVARRTLPAPGGPGGHRTLQEAGDVPSAAGSTVVPAEALQQPEGLQVLVAGVVGTGPAARSRPPSCGPGPRPAPAPHPPCAQQRPTPRAPACPRCTPAVLTPAGSSLAHEAGHSWCGFGVWGELWGSREVPPPLGRSLSCWRPSSPHGDSWVLPGTLVPALPRPLPRGLTRWRSPRPCTPRGNGVAWGGVWQSVQAFGEDGWGGIAGLG